MRGYSSEAERALAALIDDAGSGPVFVHADLLKAGRPPLSGRGRSALLDAHLAVVTGALKDRDLWVPTFNYDFARGAEYDVLNSPSQIGPFSEHVRTTVASWRTSIPIFSFAGTGTAPSAALDGVIDPFDERSAFADLVRRDGVILFYGTGLAAATILHHAERSSGPAYRYDKLFAGVVRTPDGSSRSVTLKYHVRPWERHLDYDWERLEGDALASGAVSSWSGESGRSLVASARKLVGLWADRLADDPLYLLDSETRSWVEPLLLQLRRPFQIRDFER